MHHAAALPEPSRQRSRPSLSGEVLAAVQEKGEHIAAGAAIYPDPTSDFRAFSIFHFPFSIEPHPSSEPPNPTPLVPLCLCVNPFRPPSSVLRPIRNPQSAIPTLPGFPTPHRSRPSCSSSSSERSDPLRPPPSALRPPSSVLRAPIPRSTHHLNFSISVFSVSAFAHSPSDLRPPSSVLRPPTSALRVAGRGTRLLSAFARGFRPLFSSYADNHRTSRRPRSRSRSQSRSRWPHLAGPCGGGASRASARQARLDADDSPSNWRWRMGAEIPRRGGHGSWRNYR